MRVDEELERLLNLHVEWHRLNEVGIALLCGFNVVAAALALLTLVFFQCRRRRMAGLQRYGKASYGKELVFHSPDDAPRCFRQYGLVRSPCGKLLLWLWQALFGLGWIYIILVTWLSYAPRFGAPTLFLEAFGGWAGLVGPWVIIFTEIQLLGMVLIYGWESMRMHLMFPVGSMTRATHLIIEEDPPFNTDKDLVDPDARPKTSLGCFRGSTYRIVLPIRTDPDGTRQIEYTCVRYIYRQDEDAFCPVGIASYTPMQAHEALAAGGLSQSRAREVMASCGQNEIHVRVPSVWKALVHEFANFTYIFNMIGTWSYMIYSSWNLGVPWLVMTMGTGTVNALCVVRPNLQKIARLAQLRAKCTVLRDGQWAVVNATDIVLGDLVRVDGDSTLPCDGMVVEGSLIVNESMLTGEPMPVQKMPVERSEGASASKSNFAFAGTACLQSTGPHDGRAIMIATAVGALTTRGQLVRMVLFPSSVRFKYNDQLPLVYMILTVYMIGLFVLYIFYIDLGDWIATYMMLLNTVAMTLNPMLPVSMVMGQSSAAARLHRRWSINCLQPSRIPIAGKISTMVFDKTGTITKDGMDFDSVVGVEGARLGARVRFDAAEPGSSSNSAAVRRDVPDRLRHAIASCHTVSTMEDGTLVGNQLEVAMVRASGWQVSDGMVRSPDTRESLEVLRRMEFDHRRMTSGVVVRSQCTREIEVYIKGSYEAIHAHAVPKSVPASYMAFAERCAKEGYYTLGLATKSLPLNLTGQQLADMPRSSLEANVAVCGLLLFRNAMKPDSPQAIRALRLGAVRSVICTGDNALTAISIGRQCGVVTSRVVLLGDVRDGKLTWIDPDLGDGSETDVTSSDCQLAVTQAAWRYLHQQNDEQLEMIWKRLVVFARMKPDDKISAVRFLQGRGLVVGMCGDGGNDCGALRAAHAGLALSDAEASMVAPFSTCRDGKSLITMVDLIREGRACLATNMATFQYFMVYALTLTSIRTVIALWAALSLGEFVWMTLDIGIGIAMVAAMTLPAASSKLSEFRPTATLLGPRAICAILFPFLTACAAMAVAWFLLWSKGWYKKVNPLDDLGLLPYQWMLRGDNYDSPVGLVVLLLTLTTTAYVNTYGGSFRQNILANISINVLYAVFLFMLFWLTLTRPSQFNCVFRVNCDTGQSLQAQELVPLARISEGGVGGCFLGAQVEVWQEELAAENYSDPKGASTTGEWLPSKQRRCLPPPGYNTTPYSSPAISTMGCSGPNNCYDRSFARELAIVMGGLLVLNHLFAKCVLQGPVAGLMGGRVWRASRLRRQDEEAESVLAEVQKHVATVDAEWMERALAEQEQEEAVAEAPSSLEDVTISVQVCAQATGVATPVSPASHKGLQVADACPECSEGLRFQVKDIVLQHEEKERWGLFASRVNPYGTAEVTSILPGVYGPDPFRKASRKIACCLFMKRAIW